MAVSFLSPLHLSSTLIPPRRVICSALRTQAPPPPPPSPSLAAPPQPSSSLSINPNLNPNDLNSASLSSLACALQCPHFQSCSGCTHEYDLHQPKVVDEAANFFKSLGLPDFTFDTCRLYRWRCRAKLAIRGTSRSPLIGLYEEGTHNAVDIPECKGITELDVQPYDEDSGEGELRYVQAFDSLLRKLQKYVPYGSSVVDFYGGAGVIGLSLAATRKCRHEALCAFRECLKNSTFLKKIVAFQKYNIASCVVMSVKCVEINKESKQCFEKTVSRLPMSVDSNMSWHHADAAVEPLSWLVGSDVVVVDPPRKGLDESLLHAIQSVSLAERKAKTSTSASSNSKDEKRPWILRAKEASVNVQSKTNWPESTLRFWLSSKGVKELMIKRRHPKRSRRSTHENKAIVFNSGFARHIKVLWLPRNAGFPLESKVIEKKLKINGLMVHQLLPQLAALPLLFECVRARVCVNHFRTQRSDDMIGIG
ncbi:hypothetical protein Cgig2_005547 [Carnegiea gigantea]|uniref:RNA methyltransferase n=1 Tax=Carnegiea gigantea TaxID=171969 RepID=A0A9Q1KTG6_9CARY|nr:hypothetical protein Cgig2_005547 [Carnegiea gigantea]